MLLVLNEYFKDQPIKRKIIEGLYKSGISIRDGRFFISNIEISVTEISKAFDVNRRTVYETLKAVENSEPVKKIMEAIAPSSDISRIATLTGSQILTVITSNGRYPSVISQLFPVVTRYGCYIREIFSRNMGPDESFIRIIFYRPLSGKVYDEVSKIDGVKAVRISSVYEADELLCSICNIRSCPTKYTSGIENEE
ncbi:MAG: regulator [Thermoplasmata archaeon]